ncbi:MAG: GTPase, partial [Rikenellaceae bacterium]
LNRLVGEERAIVSDIAGTTRDVIEDTITIGGVLFRLIDTAGIRQTDDRLESLGIDRTFSKVAASQLVLYVTDTLDSAHIKEQIASLKLDEHQDLIILLNKCDEAINNSNNAEGNQLLTQIEHLSQELGITIFALSALTGYGIKAIEDHLASSYDHSNDDDILITNTRHLELLQKASEGLRAAITAVDSGLPTDLTAQDIRHVLTIIGEITGEITTGDILQNIFRNFCIGK